VPLLVLKHSKLSRVLVIDKLNLILLKLHMLRLELLKLRPELLELLVLLSHQSRVLDIAGCHHLGVRLKRHGHGHYHGRRLRRR
jgi:hypothetical protein